MTEPFDHTKAVAIILERDRTTEPLPAHAGHPLINHDRICGCDREEDSTDGLRVVRRVLANGVENLWLQCGRCGRGRALRRSLCRNLAALPEWEDGISNRAWEQKRTELEADKARKEEERRAFYNKYMQSTEWATKREKVIKRAGGICECCAEGRAVQAHHTTYVHLGNEPLWELRAVCRKCHEWIHKIADNDTDEEQA